jgi:hypothetical protein
LRADLAARNHEMLDFSSNFSDFCSLGGAH